MNAEEWRSVYTTAATNRYGDAALFSNPSDGFDGFYSWDIYDTQTGELIHPANSSDNNWKDVIMGDGGGFDKFSVNASGGTGKTTFYTSLLYRNDNGYLHARDEQRFNLRLNVIHDFTDWFRTGINLSGFYRKPGEQSLGGMEDFLTTIPIYPIKSPSNEDRYWYKFGIAPNLYAEREYSASFENRYAFLNSAYIEIRPLKNLLIRSELQSDYGVNKNRNWSHPFINPPGTGAGGGFGMTTVNKNEGHTWNNNNTVEYKLELGNHKLDLLAGANIMDSWGGSSTAFQESIANSTFQFSNGFYDREERVASGWGSYRFAAGLGRLNYSYKGKYFLESSYRKDGSSRFGPDMRWGDFIGVSGSWIFSEENFIANAIPFIYMGRIRGSWGEVGNAETGENFGYLGTSLTWFNYGGYRGEGFQSIGNSSLQWETTRQTDFGLDLAFFRGRIEFNTDYFYKLSEDLLLSYRIGQFHGYWSSSITQNVGSLMFRGWEFAVKTVNIESLRGSFGWSTDFNLTTSQSEVLKLSNNAHNLPAGNNIAVVGQPLGAYYLPQWAGVDPVTGHELIYEVDPVEYLLNPAATYKEHLTGNVIDAQSMKDGAFAQQKIIDPNKSPYPNIYGGISNTFLYKGFELSVLFSYQFGNWYYDNMRQSMSYISNVKNGSPELLNGWTGENPTNIPLLESSPMASRSTSRFLDDASFIRLRDVTLRYELPKNMASALLLDNVSIFAKAQNSWLWSRWHGIEPEATFGAFDNINPGQRGFVKPMAMTFVLGLDLGF